MNTKSLKLIIILLLSACVAAPAGRPDAGAEKTITLNAVDAKGVGAEIGTVKLMDTSFGLALYPSLRGLPPGSHGFHIHENPSCNPADQNGTPVSALGAGGHFDPQAAKKHGEPWGNGHMGDLPPLLVNADGAATTQVLAPRLKLADVKNRALMVHAGGDNFSDQPTALGGGGARIACGVIGT